MFGTLMQSIERVWWGVLAYGIAVKYIIYELIGRKTRWFKRLRGKELPRHDGKLAVVTGGSRGIGLEIVKNILESGYRVVIGSSASTESRQKLEESLKKMFPQALVEVWHLDLASQKSVAAFSDKYISSGLPLHLLINNAGIMFVKEEISEDGYEKHFAVNYLSHCLLTFLLLPLLSKSGSTKQKSRIINCTSCIHFVGNMNVENLLKKQFYSKYRAYTESKLAQVMFTYSLQAHLESLSANVTVNSVHPGVVNTELMSKELIFPSTGSLFFKTAKEGAETATFAALSSEMEGVGGKYLEECEPVLSSKVSQDVSTQKDLWKKTLSLLNPWITEKSLTLS